MRTRPFLFLAFAASLGNLPLACSDSAVSPGQDASADAVAPPPPPPPAPDATPDAADAAPSLRFSTCPGGYSGVCAKVDMPLDHSAPGGKTVGVLLNKLVTSPRPTAQLWVLQGGPGASASEMAQLARDVANVADGLEIYTIEHRGVGASNRLGCPREEARYAAAADAGPDAGLPPPPDTLACLAEAQAAYGGDLAHYNVTNAAKDLARAIELVRRPELEVYVYGVSYGTMWAQRFLQVAPKAADAVVLDSLVVPGQIFLSRFMTQADPVAQKLAEVCKLDPACVAALGTDPWARIVATKARVDAGHCEQAGMRDPRARLVLTQMLRIHDLSAYALAAWARLDRCTPADVDALRTLAGRGNIFSGPGASLASDVLGLNIALSELWETPPPAQGVLDQRNQDTVFPGEGPGAAVHAAWPKYAKDEYADKLPDAQVPVLVLNGTFDTQTPIEIAQLTKDHYSKPGRTFVTVPFANHTVIAQSPVETSNGKIEHCGMTLLAAFLKAPTAPLDTACASKVKPPSFARESGELRFFFGTESLFSATLAPGGGSTDRLDLPTSIVAARRLPGVLDPRRRPY